MTQKDLLKEYQQQKLVNVLAKQYILLMKKFTKKRKNIMDYIWYNNKPD